MRSLRSNAVAALLCALAWVGLAGTSQAAQFVFVAPCTVDCSAIGVPDATFVGGTFTVNDSALSDNLIEQSELQGLFFSIGNLTFGLADVLAFGVLVDAAGTTGIAWSMFMLNGVGGFIAQNDGIATNAFIAGTSAAIAQGGPGAVVRLTVSEPATLALLGLGLVAASLARRRAMR